MHPQSAPQFPLPSLSHKPLLRKHTKGRLRAAPSPLYKHSYGKLLTVVKIRTATDGSGSTQQRVLKQNYLQSFKTRRFGFCHGWQWFHAAASFKAKLFTKL
ncbi:hypothetical protein DWQ65_02625 [Treponema phagedenis]|nr:hypothetical protein DWQ65_02625 [Treponema phagedenis]